MLKVKVKSPYGSPRQRGVEVILYEDKFDPASGRWSGEIYDDSYVKKLRSIRITTPHIRQLARESNFLVQKEPDGRWFEALFNGTRMSWKEN